MATFQSFLDIFKKNSELDYIYDLDLIQETAERAYLKKMAIDTVIDFVGRTVAESEFRMYDEGKLNKSDWYYKLNVRPNTDTSATTFWQKLIYKLIYDNEVLVVVSDTNDLLIADSFIRTEYALYEDRFSEVIVKDYKFNRSFVMNEVIYLEYNNAKMAGYVDGLFSDYGELFGRMVDRSLRNSQIRGTVNVEQTRDFSDKTTERLQKFVNKLFDAFSNNSIAIVPTTKGIEYEEVSNGSGENQSFEEIIKLKTTFTSEVAKLVGVPPALIHGEMADLEENEKAYVKFCIKPLLKKIEDELNAKLFEPKEFLNGSHVDVIGVDKPNIFELATAIDKLVGSGSFSRNELREKLGEEPVDDPAMDTYYITKNYEEVGSLEGGDDE